MNSDPPLSLFITGASSGLGEALALAYAAPGIRMGLVARRGPLLKNVGGQAEKAGAQVTLYEGDVTDKLKMEGIARDFLDHFSAPDLIFANAGQGSGSGYSIERSLMDVNYFGVQNTILPFLPALQEKGRGHIAVISSLASYRGLPGSGAYCASKAALNAWSDSLRLCLFPFGITVTIVNPGYIRTEMTQSNPPMPFCWSAGKAAATIRQRLRHRPARIEFPFPMVVSVRLLALLPPRWGDYLIRWSRLHKAQKTEETEKTFLDPGS